MARFNNGWVKIYRSAWENDLGDNPYLFALWSTLLIMATWKESKIRWMGKQRDLPAGSVVLGVGELADKWNCSRSVLQKHLHYLHDTGRIVLEACSRGTLVTICNWSLYQSKEDEACEPSVNGVLAECSPRVNGEALIEEVKKEESISPSAERKKSRSPLGAISELSGEEILTEALEAVTHKTQRAWLKAYPDVNWLRREIFKAVAWLEANPRKKSKSMARFLGNWFVRGWEQHRKTIPTNSGINTTPIDLESA